MKRVHIQLLFVASLKNYLWSLKFFFVWSRRLFAPFFFHKMQNIFVIGNLFWVTLHSSSTFDQLQPRIFHEQLLKLKFLRILRSNQLQKYFDNIRIEICYLQNLQWYFNNLSCARFWNSFFFSHFTRMSFNIAVFDLRFKMKAPKLLSDFKFKSSVRKDFSWGFFIFWFWFG